MCDDDSWLIFRLFFGFGKTKFFGTSLKHSCYIKSFLVIQPIPSKIGYVLHVLPLFLHQLLLAGLFVFEIIAPMFLWIGTPHLQLFPFLSFALLQIGIQACGNFGFFNMLSLALSVVVLDTHSSIWQFSLQTWYDGLFLVLAIILGFGGLISLPFNNWAALGWMYWPVLSWKPMWILDFYRHLMPLRIVHAYGVFPRFSTPPVRFQSVFEGKFIINNNQQQLSFILILILIFITFIITIILIITFVLILILITHRHHTIITILCLTMLQVVLMVSLGNRIHIATFLGTNDLNPDL